MLISIFGWFSRFKACHFILLNVFYFMGFYHIYFIYFKNLFINFFHRLRESTFIYETATVYETTTVCIITRLADPSPPPSSSAPDTTSTHQPSLPTTTTGDLAAGSTAKGQCHRPSLLSSFPPPPSSFSYLGSLPPSLPCSYATACHASPSTVLLHI